MAEDGIPGLNWEDEISDIKVVEESGDKQVLVGRHPYFFCLAAQINSPLCALINYPFYSQENTH